MTWPFQTVGVRALAYLAATVLTSQIAAVVFTALAEDWTRSGSPNVASDALWFSPACVVAAIAPVESRGARMVAAALSVGVVVVWAMAFAARESSTAGLAFLWAWIAGVPAVAAFVVVQSVRRGRN